MSAQGGGDDDAGEFVLPRIPASAGGLIFDGSGRLLIVNPTYKKHWTIPGGIMEATARRPGRGAGARCARRSGST